jgi:hypothetical protein
MATKAISEATSKGSLADTDMVPLAAASDNTAYHITGANLKASMPAATTSSKGTVELASAADLAAGTSGVAVEAGTLKDAYAGKHYYTVTGSPPTYSTIHTTFFSTFGRYPTGGEIVVIKDAGNVYYLLVYTSAAFVGWKLSDMSTVTFS